MQILSNSVPPLAILPNLWVIHPWVTITITFLLVVTVILCVFQATKGVLEIVVAARGGRRKLLVSLVLAIGILAVLLWAACWIFQEMTRPRPIITSKVGKVLSPDYSLEWSYPDEQNGKVKYFVSVTDKDTGVSAPPRLALLPNARVAQTGNMLVQVQAVAPDSSSVKSELVEVDWYKDSIERIQKTRELVVGVHADNSEGLFCYRTGEKGEYEGFDIELIEQIEQHLEAKYGLQLTVRKVFVPWPDIIQRPNLFDIDFAIASISITPERKDVMLFSRSYHSTSIAILQPANKVSESDRAKLFTFQEFENAKIGVHRGTTEVDFIKLIQKLKPKLEIRPANNNTELFTMLQSSEVDAVLYDYDRTHAEMKHHPNWVARQIDYDDLRRNGVAVTPEQYGIVLAKVNDALLKDIDEVITKLLDKNQRIDKNQPPDKNWIDYRIEDRIRNLKSQ